MACDTELRECVRNWSRVHKVCSMHIERMLARCKRSSGSSQQAPTVESLCSRGFLSEWLRVHVAGGGQNPQVTH
eukprot:4091689-Alexandrium_andersonii.AAC.1